MHSHHSHSGDYISHATGSLDKMVQVASDRGFTHFCLTEHMPRFSDQYLYPEELEKNMTSSDLMTSFENYLAHARRIQAEFNGKGRGEGENPELSPKSMKILVGFEVEGIDQNHILEAKRYSEITDMCVGSVHFVHGIPIDFDQELWLKARLMTSEGTSRALYKDYFELQYLVLTGINPEVIGHFDLIRLFQPLEIDPTTAKDIKNVSIESDWPEVWDCIVRNIKYVVSYGGLFELNSAALRKGWTTPYIQEDLAQAVLKYGGKFCLSDDSHTYEQVGLNYSKVLEYVTQVLKLEHLYHLDLDLDGKTVVVEDRVIEVMDSSFWR